jgi:hypothetical protein
MADRGCQKGAAPLHRINPEPSPFDHEHPSIIVDFVGNFGRSRSV